MKLLSSPDQVELVLVVNLCGNQSNKDHVISHSSVYTGCTKQIVNEA